MVFVQHHAAVPAAAVIFDVAVLLVLLVPLQPDGDAPDDRLPVAVLVAGAEGAAGGQPDLLPDQDQVHGGGGQEGQRGQDTLREAQGRGGEGEL